MKIILNVATHGNERIGLKVAKEIQKLNIGKDILTIQIANKKAAALNKRFIDQDLNRSFPGKKNGNHEQKIAYELSPAIKLADVVIDIHSTTSDLKDALIITKINKITKKYLKIVQPKYVLLMNATKDSSLISQAKAGIGFEYGKDKDALVLKKTVLGIKRLFNYLKIIDYKPSRTNIKTTYFNVTSSVPKPKGYKLLSNIKNYKLIKKGQAYAKNGKGFITAKETFYPILFGEKTYSDTFGFMGKKQKNL